MTTRYLLGVTVFLAVAGAVFAQPTTLPTPRTASAPVALPSLPQLADEVNPPAVVGAETSGLPPAVPSVAAAEAAPPPRVPMVWGSAEYLAWWVSDAPLRTPLANGTVPSGPIGLQPGFDGLGRFDVFSGGRLRLGMWFDADRSWGAAAGGFFLEQRNAVVAVGADNPPLERIFFDAGTGQPIVVPVSVPNVLIGGVTASASLRFRGAEAGLSAAVLSRPWCRLELTAGYRYLDLREVLSVLQESQVAPGAAVPTPLFGTLTDGDVLHVFDRIQTTNTFHGAQVGARAEWDSGTVSLGLGGKVGVGAVREEVRAAGATVLTTASGAAAFAGPGGLLVQATNAGVSSRTRAGFESELEVTAKVQLFPCVRLVGGYSALYWEGVARPGNQLDAVINPAQFPLGAAFRPGPLAGPARPVIPFRLSDFWAQGLSVGLEISY